MDDPWDISTIRRLQIRLSELRPIAVTRDRYRDRQSTLFDMHYGVELGIVLSGRMRRHYRNGRVDVSTGDVWLCGMWEPHGFEVLAAPCEVVVLVIWPPALAGLRFEESAAFNWLAPFTVAATDRPRVDRRDRRAIRDLGRRLARLCAAEEPVSRLWLRLLLMEVLLTICRRWTASASPPNAVPDAAARISRALELVFAGRERVTTQAAAKTCGMGRNTFSRLFQDLMGIGFADFGLRYRLHGAAAQLAHTASPIKAVAAGWGFTDASHLHRCFVSHYGCTPAEYRKENTNKFVDAYE